MKSAKVTLNLCVRYGFPKSDWTNLVSSSSVDINEEIFGYWVSQILVSRMDARRKMLGLPIDTKGLIILDGCLSHTQQKLEGLLEHFIGIISLFLIVLTLFNLSIIEFSHFTKWVFKNTHCQDTENKVRRWTMKELIVISHVTTPAHIRSSFWRGGIKLNYNAGKSHPPGELEYLIDATHLTWFTSQRRVLHGSTAKEENRTKTAMKGFT